MNRRLSEDRIRTTCRELMSTGVKVSGRGLRLELRKRFGAVGKNSSVFAIWREEARARESGSNEVRELQERARVAEAKAKENLERAQRAEYREQAHQDHWAIEVDRLRQEVATLRGPSRVLPV